MPQASLVRAALGVLAGALVLGIALWWMLPREELKALDNPNEMLARAQALAEEGDEEAAAELLAHAARLGLAEAQYRLGLAYLRGRGVDADAHEAARWFRIAMRMGGHAKAAEALAKMLEQGRGVARDEEEARRLYAFAAARGIGTAMYRLAVMQNEGRGGPRDLEAAARWAHAAVQAGVVEARGLLARAKDAIRDEALAGDPRMMLALAHLYAHGWGVERSDKLARAWLVKAAQAGLADAAWEYAQQRFREGANEADLLPWLRTAAHSNIPKRKGVLGALLVRLGHVQEGKDVLLEAARAGDAYAALNLGILAFTGMEGARDPSAAAAWWQRAAEAGLARAYNDLGAWALLESHDVATALARLEKAASQVPEAAFNLALLRLQGAARSPEEALRWMRQAAQADLPSAWFGMGVLYEVGIGAGRNLRAAMRWYRKAAEAGVVEAMINLALLRLAQGDDARARAEAKHWLTQAAQRGHPYAQAELGARILLGEIPGTVAEARKWLQEAAQQGVVEALYNLAGLYRRGEGVPQNDAQALTLYRKAATQGFAPAMNALAYMYALGRGTRRDLARARAWLEKAAEAGDALARRNLDALAKGGRLELLAVARNGKPLHAILHWTDNPARWILYDRKPVLALGNATRPAAASHAPSNRPASDT